MKVIIGNTVETSYLLVSRGAKNSRVVSLAHCQVEQCVQEYRRRISNNINGWSRIYHQMIMSMSHLISTTSCSRFVYLKSNWVTVNGIALCIFTRDVAKNECDLQMSEWRQAIARRNHRISRQEFVQNVRQVGENINRVVQSIQIGEINESNSNRVEVIAQNTQSRSFPSKNVDDLRWDLDFEDSGKKTCNKIEKSLRWDLDWE